MPAPPATAAVNTARRVRPAALVSSTTPPSLRHSCDRLADASRKRSDLLLLKVILPRTASQDAVAVVAAWRCPAASVLEASRTLILSTQIGLGCSGGSPVATSNRAQNSMSSWWGPWPCPGRGGGGGFGSSATIASVVISRPATEAASCSAVRTTLVGSMMPFWIRLPYSPPSPSYPNAYSSFSTTFPTTTEPSPP